MTLCNFRKETSERSDSSNWAKSLLINIEGYYFDSIEGCNQNANNVVTHLIERARVDYKDTGNTSVNEILSQIKNLEGEDSLLRKINFSSCFALPLTYALYCDENEKVILFNIHSLTNIELLQNFNSYKEFSDGIAKIKGWVSRKPFRENQDLPNFDKKLRQAGTAWPTNIDCFICNKSNTPIGILEFQNAKNTLVASHKNNDYFLCKIAKSNQYGHLSYHDDIRRWTSQEILRVQSKLRFFVITWAQQENDSYLKEIELITIPYLPEKNGKPDWDFYGAYKKDLNEYVSKNYDDGVGQKIASKYKTFNFNFLAPNMTQTINNSPLSKTSKTFPYIYFKSKVLIQGNRAELANRFATLISE